MAIKIGVAEAPPFYMAGIWFVAAVAILGVIAALRRFRFPPSIRAWLSLAYPGLYMFGISYGLVYLAEQYIDSSLTAVLFGSFPFCVAIVSSIKLKDGPIGLIGWLGLILGFSGVVVISHAQWQTSQNLFIGTILVLSASLSAAYGIIIHKKYHSQQNLVVATMVQMLAGGVPLLLIAYLTEDISRLEFTNAAIGSVVYLTVFGSVIALLLYNWLLRQTRLIVVAMIASVTLLIAITLGWLVMGEMLSFRIAIGAGLVLSGILAVIRRQKVVVAIPEHNSQ